MLKTRTKSSMVLILCDHAKEITGLDNQIKSLGYNIEMRKKSRGSIKDANAFSLVVVSVGTDIDHDTKVVSAIKKMWPDLATLLALRGPLKDCEHMAEIADGFIRLQAPADINESRLQLFLQPFNEPQRLYERLQVNLVVNWSPDGQSVILGTVTNISAGGMFVKEDTEIPARAAVVSFILKGEGNITFEGKGVVRWASQGSSPGDVPGFGIEFLPFENNGHEFLGHLGIASK